MRVALVGLMGAGKTRAGKVLAERLHWPYHDADRLIEAQAGESITEIFRSRGEAAFRGLETECLRQLAQREPPFVVSLGGGVVEQRANRVLLADRFAVVWIQIDPREAARRLAGKTDRPLLGTENPLEVLQRLAARRSPHYYRVSDIQIPTTRDVRPEGLAERIRVELLRR